MQLWYYSSISYVNVLVKKCQDLFPDVKIINSNCLMPPMTYPNAKRTQWISRDVKRANIVSISFYSFCFLVPCGRLSWLVLAYECTLISSIVSCCKHHRKSDGSILHVHMFAHTVVQTVIIIINNPRKHGASAPAEICFYIRED